MTAGLEEALTRGTPNPSHELVQVVRGRRTGLAITVAIHSTARGPGAGGCRIAHYPAPAGAVADALRLAEAMTGKNALAGLPYGGGKTVVALPSAAPPAGAERTALLHDIGDTIEALGGRYITGPDVGSTPADMTVIGERTTHVCCRPAEHGGRTAWPARSLMPTPSVSPPWTRRATPSLPEFTSSPWSARSFWRSSRPLGSGSWERTHPSSRPNDDR